MQPSSSLRHRHGRRGKRPKKPIDIGHPCGTPLPGGVIRVFLRTLDELEAFWQGHHDRLPFAATGVAQVDGQIFLDEYEWYFSPEIPALVKTVTRWDETGIRVFWYDWAQRDPGEHADYFQDRADERETRLRQGNWTLEDEAEYRRRTTDNYRGCWMLENLPCDILSSDWLAVEEEICDPHLSPAEVAERFQIQTFWDWMASDAGEVEFMTADLVDAFIAYWRGERACGREYYGAEHEPAG